MSDRIPRDPVRPDRVRRITGGFAFVPSRFLTDGFLESLTDDERVLYLFLLLAGDRRGVSYYSVERISHILRHTTDQVREARGRLIRRDLLAFDGLRYQVLELPDHPTALRPLRPRP
jgi:hypothetical protein